MPSGYKHLTRDDRSQIYALRKTGMSNRAIARELGVSHTTIMREVDRNSGGRGYRIGQAQGKSEDRRRRASCRPRKMTPLLWALVAALLAEGWSPEQLSGRLRLMGVPMAGREWIYRHVRADRRRGGTLYLHLRRRGKKPNWKGGAHSGRGHIPNRKGIEDRPWEVDAKIRVGDWEADTVIGARHSGALVSVVERVTHMTLLARVDARTAEAVGDALKDGLAPWKALVLTLTSDNGKEFAGHADVSKALGAEFYFARPYRSCDRGLNEHVNGLLREYFPKGTDFRKVTDADVRAVQDRLNRRPRKALGYRTPEEAFNEALSLAA